MSSTAWPWLSYADIAEGYRRGGSGWLRHNLREREEGIRQGTLAGVDHRATCAKLRRALARLEAVRRTREERP